MSTTKQRFVEFSHRAHRGTIDSFRSESVPTYVANIKHAKWNYLTWKQLTLMKDPMSLAIYQQMLQDLRPRTILEFGTYEGGSALWMCDVMHALQIDCEVHTFDIDCGRVKLPCDVRVHFHQLDNY